MATADPPRPASSHPAFLLSQLGFFVKSRFSARLEPLGINPRQFETLRVLSQTSGLTQQHVGESLNIHRNVMVGLVDELEERGLTERRRHPHDRRAYEVHLLPAGRKVFAKAEQILDEFEHTELLDTLTTAERQTLGDLLRRVSTAAGLHPDVHPAAQAQKDHARKATSDR